MDNIAQCFYLCNVCPWLTDNFYEENNPYSVVSTMLGQHCIGILFSQCCSNTSETTLHKKITCAILAPSAQIYFLRKTSGFKYVWRPVFFNRVKYHETILALFVHCCLGSSFTACGTTMNWGRHRLEQLQHHYDNGKRYLITISFQCQYVIGLHPMKIQQKTDVATISRAHWDI